METKVFNVYITTTHFQGTITVLAKNIEEAKEEAIEFVNDLSKN